MSSVFGQQKITVEELFEMELEEGFFYELINGNIVKKQAPAPPHQKAVLKLSKIFDNFAEEKDLGQEITETEEALLELIEEKHQKRLLAQKNLIDQSWQLGAELREMNFPQKIKELEDLKMVEHLVSWRPSYYGSGNSQDRIAEALLKQERDLYKIKRPQQLANRNVYVRIAEPTNLGSFADQYQNDAHGLLSSVTKNLHDQIQTMIDEIIYKLQTR